MKGRFILDHGVREGVVYEREAAGPTVSTIRKQREVDAEAQLCFSFSCSSGFQAWIGVNLYSGSPHPS